VKLVLLSLFVALSVVIPTVAQEGHPLTGTWLGEWGPMEEQITIVMNWNGKTRMMEGQFNPGPNKMPLKITLDSSKWTVHLETVFKDDDGKTAPVVADGKLENVGSYKRFITGTWTQGNQKGNFKLGRD
jgi:hypothetical protein